MRASPSSQTRGKCRDWTDQLEGHGVSFLFGSGSEWATAREASALPFFSFVGGAVTFRVVQSLWRPPRGALREGRGAAFCRPSGGLKISAETTATYSYDNPKRRFLDPDWYQTVQMGPNGYHYCPKMAYMEPALNSNKCRIFGPRLYHIVPIWL